ncbi:MAG: trypsin-like serine protease [Erythrobacter sp.]|nr:trypsin-like serine protease [Erythrobacter sp.]
MDEVEINKRPISGGMPTYTYGLGWAEVEQGESTAALMGGKLELVTLDECTDITGFDDEIRLHSMLCAQGRGGSDTQTCYGDSGGPLIHYEDSDLVPRVIGVVRSGRKCGTTGEASRFTLVAAARDWIDQTMSAR